MRQFVFFCLLFVHATCWSTIVRKEIYFDQVKATKVLNIFIPDTPPVSGSLPLVVLLHGYGGHSDEWIETFSLGALLAKAIDDGQIVPMIVVLPDFHLVTKLNGFTFKSSFYVDSRRGAYERYFLDGVLRYIESNFPVTTNPRYRAIEGHSFGGTAAMRIATVYGRKYFGHVAAHSGPMSYAFFLNLPAVTEHIFRRFSPVSIMAGIILDILNPGPGFDWNLFGRLPGVGAFDKTGHDLEYMGINHINNLKSMSIYFSCGKNDQARLHYSNRLFSGLLTHHKIPHTYVETPYGHYENMLKDILAYLRFLSIIHFKETTLASEAEEDNPLP